VKLCECGCGRPAPIAEKTDSAWGYVKGQPKRFIRGHNTNGGMGEVPVDPFRERFLTLQTQGTRAADVARRMGWFTFSSYHGRTIADGPRVRRALGLKVYSPGRGYEPRYRERLTYPTAVKLCRALNLDPVDLDL
jgi:hypothetical protein